MHRGGTLHAVGVLPSDVSEAGVKAMARMMQEAGITSFETLSLDLSDPELEQPADQIMQLPPTTP